MDKAKAVKALKDQDFRDSLENADITSSAGVVNLDDDALQSISGGCMFTTIATSCVPPGTQCP